MDHPPAQTGEPQSPNIFNPELTVIGSFLKRSDDQPAYGEDFTDHGPTGRVDDQFLLREVEVDIRAAISPWADGVLTISFESVTETEFTVGIEEAFVNFKRLPFVDAPPGGLKLKAGRFRADFGRMNRVHQHDLPQPEHPRAMETFLGDHGYIGTGVSGQFFLPFPVETSALQASVEYLNGGSVPVAVAEPARESAGIGRLNLFNELTSAQTLDAGASVWTDGSKHSIYGVDLAYKWEPPEQGTWRSFILGTELFLGDFDEPGFDDDPLAYYGYAQFQFNSATYAGLTYDFTQELTDQSIVTKTYGAYVTRYAAEFLRFRLGYEHIHSDVVRLNDLDTVYLEMAFVFGAHPIDPYWVNR
jgi:hypothetical protein